MTFVHMADAEDYVMRPVVRGLCSYESLLDGSVDLFDVARMNEALDVDDENRLRVQEAMSDGRGV